LKNNLAPALAETPHPATFQKLFFNTHLFFQGSLKTGWTNLSNIRTTGRNDIDKAQQKISYLENYWVLGYIF